MNSIAAIYGSAANPATAEKARDIDVAYTGPREPVEALVTAWAAEHGLAHLPIDWHPARLQQGVIILPAPCGIRGHAIPLTPHTDVAWNAVYGLASTVRAYGNGDLAAHLEQTVRLTVIPRPDSRDEDEYVEGLTALRSAVAKTLAPERTAALLAQEYGLLLARLLAQDPRPTPQGLEYLQYRSPWAADGAVLVLLRRREQGTLLRRGTQGTATLEYERLAEQEVEALLYPA
ncbi:hypothetical protein GCM10010156_48480 [Planobispora rosea]|uniref:Uncharacterized protein n=1 Tax=Planobispora rosea TaxID=35762 RepID=A0A8J3WDW4_PLARO|nr:hypothetical protein [Planobispora rosea]GGS84204.1 hypothetical protein GCM10010156_48480 [Planobispora rosea]GIH86359.1 hypothetical protein Pro02_47670 [Planobispora rosea]